MKFKTIGGREVDLPESTTVINQINESTKGKLHDAGSIFFSELPELSEDLVGNMYNIKDDFTTTDKFVEGADHDFFAGANIAIVDIGGELVYDVVGGNDTFDFAEDHEVQDMLNGLYKS
jgi:hypothetical protein